MSDSLVAIGLISGTSADGIDAVLIRSDGEEQHELLAFTENPYPKRVRDDVLALYHPGPNEIDRMGKLDAELGELFAKAALGVCKSAGISPSQVDVIGSHGQTIRHRPPDFTLQIANPAVISSITGIKTIADFRRADMALGGEGAPMVPLFHKAVFNTKGKATGVLNLGGIANLTILSKSGEILVAGDTGPASTLIDLLVGKIAGVEDEKGLCDLDGLGAKAGQVDAKALAWLLQHEYLQRPYPKSTGREMFGIEYLNEFLALFPDMVSKNGLATLTCFTAKTIAMACEELFAKEQYRLVSCGGGAKNPTLLSMIAHELPEVEMVVSSDLGVDSDSLESQCFAWFAIRTLKGLTSSVPEATGATKAAILGAVNYA
ncbi:MAG: anhydro-N-acetylmuramic acid kinase [Magnetococcales bacterium]|nr:anhydro-N-acetylmuramic acid kinase [Magnetococcales bacterium]